jgi:hypothetical protein
VHSRARQLGLDALVILDANEMQTLDALNDNYFTKGFEYFNIKAFSPKLMNLPTLRVLDELAQRLLDALRPLCLKAIND